MQNLNTYGLLALALWLGLAPAARADRDRDRDRNRSGAPTQAHSLGGPTPGQCVLGTSERDLDINNVLARAFITGSLFYGNSSANAYYVPQTAGSSPVYASGLWIGGLSEDGTLQVAGATYEDYEFWPGPLNEDGTLPNPVDCSPYDRIYKVGQQDIQNYLATGTAAADLAGWPVGLGAPTFQDLNGNNRREDGEPDVVVTSREQVINLGAGERPELFGDQALWWVMNDLGNTHDNTQTPPIGVEVQVLAFSFARADALNDITFYRYRVIKRTPGNLNRAYLSIFSDPDLGDSADDYVASDTVLTMGIVYNADNEDGSGGGVTYGANPPAIGYDFFQGPIVDLDNEGVRNDTLGLTAFSYFSNEGPTSVTSDPALGTEIYNYMQSRWKDGVPMTVGGNGYNPGSNDTTRFAYPGDPVTGDYWSELQPTLGGTTPNVPNDRRFMVTTGPFTLEPNVPQDVIFGIVYGRGSSNLNSIEVLRNADVLAQTAFDINFRLASAPPPPTLCDPNSENPQLRPGTGSCLEAVEENGRVTLVFGYPTASENYLGSYEVVDRLLVGQGLADTTYNFEAFNVYRYPDSNFDDSRRELVATYDVANAEDNLDNDNDGTVDESDEAVTTVIDERFDPETSQIVPFVAFRGSDNGVQYYYEVPGLTNYTDYYYGVTALAYSPNSIPKIIESSATKITVRPSQVAASQGGSRTQTEFGTEVAGAAQGLVQGLTVPNVRIVDPTRVTGATYTLEVTEFTTFTPTCQSPSEPVQTLGAPVQTYNIYRDGQLVFSGQQAFESTSTCETVTVDGQEVSRFLSAGTAPPISAEESIVVDGVAFVFDTGAYRSPVAAELAEETLAGLAATPPAPPDFAATPGATPTNQQPIAVGIVEVANPAAPNVCPGVTADGNANDPAADDGCELGFGNTVWHDANVTGDYYAGASGGTGGSAGSVAQLKQEGFEDAAPPDDLEMRFTAAGGYAVYYFGAAPNPTLNKIVRVPFEIWNVGTSENDPSDDVRMIPFLRPSAPLGVTPAPVTDWANQFPYEDPWPNDSTYGDSRITESVYFMMPDRPDGYALFEQATLGFGGAGATYVPANDGDGLEDPDCANGGYYVDFCYRDVPAEQTVSLISRFAIGDAAGDGTTPPTGTVIRMYTVPKPFFVAGDRFSFSTAGLEFVTNDRTTAEGTLDLIGIVPNPYLGSSAYETNNLDRVVRFTNLPEQVRIRIYTIDGTLIRTLDKTGPDRSLDWDLETQSNLPVASGMYLVHVEVPGLGDRVLKFGVVNRQNQITVF